MNKKFTKLIPYCILAAALLFFIATYFICKMKYDEYSGEKGKFIRNTAERQKAEAEANQFDAEKRTENMKLKSIKPIYETDYDISSTQNLGVFGKMFDEIIKNAQKNGLLIRSIEYNMNPDSDPIYAEANDLYNVCDLKFFFVGSYSQLQAFLIDLTKNFNYFLYLSSLNVTAFPSNTDYLLINTTITLYSKKPEQKRKR